MIILPAIDLIDGTCVRLTQGDYSTSEQVAADPVETAFGFKGLGAEWLHMVDLDGAAAKEPRNKEIICRVAKETGLNIEVGGGIRGMQTIEAYLNDGIKRVILGSAALFNPGLVKDAVTAFGTRIAVGIDTKDDFVQTNGWAESSEMRLTELAVKMADAGVSTIIHTDISRDGMLSGPNLETLRKLKECVPGVNLIASGGIHDILDIIALKNLGMYGTICGKSIYKGTLNLDQAIAAAKV